MTSVYICKSPFFSSFNANICSSLRWGRYFAIEFYLFTAGGQARSSLVRSAKLWCSRFRYCFIFGMWLIWLSGIRRYMRWPHSENNRMIALNNSRPIIDKQRFPRKIQGTACFDYSIIFAWETPFIDYRARVIESYHPVVFTMRSAHSPASSSHSIYL